MINETKPVSGLSYNKERADTALSDVDGGLVAKSLRGEIEAFEQLVTKYQKKMLNIAYRLIGDYDEACDVVQETFVSAYKNLGAFRREARFSTWLTTITLNHAKNRLKQIRARQNRIAYSLGDTIETNDGEIMIDPPSNQPSILKVMESRDVQNKVRECIDALEPDYREVVVLRDLQDFSYGEIGTVLKVREGTVKSRLFRAREAIKDCLKRALGEI